MNQGYILEVDVEYPEELHDLHNNYLPGPNTLAPRPKYYHLTLKIFCHNSATDLCKWGTKKLIPTLLGECDMSYTIAISNVIWRRCVFQYPIGPPTRKVNGCFHVRDMIIYNFTFCVLYFYSQVMQDMWFTVTSIYYINR